MLGVLVKEEIAK